MRWLVLLIIFLSASCDKRDSVEYIGKESNVAYEKETPQTTNFQLTQFPNDEITVMSWNLEWFPGRGMSSSDREKLNHITSAREILSKNPSDIICFQEILNEEAVNDLVGSLPDYKVHVISNFPGRQQVAIASSIQPIAGYQEDFHPGGSNPPRGFAFAAYRDDNDYILIYCVHLKSNLGDARKNYLKREESARQLVEHSQKVSSQFRAQGAEKVGIIIAGDFNTDPKDQRYSKEKTSQILKEGNFEWAWEGSSFNERVTWKSDGRYPDACFDHFFLSGVEKVKCLLLKDSEKASDHRAIVLRFEMP